VKENRTPYVCHVLVCVNDRQGARKSCADGQSVALKDRLKDEAAKRGWTGRVRVSQSGCLGLCQKGPNVMLYPQGIWFSEVTPQDADQVLEKVAEILKSTNSA
jgi:(2Fe-2S) ferredoxin